MSFIRPEAAQSLYRWHEALIGGAVAALGAWWALGLNGILSWVGWVVLPAGALLCLTGLQRGRFRGATGGPGLVQIDEGRITYFGPLTGGTVDIADMTALALDPSAKPAHWVLSHPGQPPVLIPITASGADKLFDAFSTLPGLRTERLLAARRDATDSPVTIWRAGSVKRLH